MFEEDHAPVTRNEIYHQASSCQRIIALAEDRNRAFNRLQPLDNYTDIILTGCGSSHNLAICASFALSEMLQRPVTSVASSEIAHFPDHYLIRNAKRIVIANSRSGDVERLRTEM
jgi:fructoselysine-6-P-deglycase FrlB-like protein